MIPAAASRSHYFGLNEHNFLDPWLLHGSGGSRISGGIPSLGWGSPICYSTILLPKTAWKCQNLDWEGTRPRALPWIRHCTERSVPIAVLTATQPLISCILQNVSFYCHWSFHRRILRFTTRWRARCQMRGAWRFCCCTGWGSAPRRGRTSAPCTCWPRSDTQP